MRYSWNKHIHISAQIDVSAEEHAALIGRNGVGKTTLIHLLAGTIRPPTNHLDRETLGWLETWVRKFSGAVLFTSHDRYFIDQVPTQRMN